MFERRQCAKPGCERLFLPRSVAHKFCREHSRTKAPDESRRLRYGWGHQRSRAQWAPAVVTGKINCARCGLPIGPSEPWDLGHVDGAGPRAYSGPEHTRCNRATSGRNGNGRPRIAGYGPDGPFTLEDAVHTGKVSCRLCGWLIRTDQLWEPGEDGPVHAVCEREPRPPGPPYSTSLRSLDL